MLDAPPDGFVDILRGHAACDAIPVCRTVPLKDARLSDGRQGTSMDEAIVSTPNCDPRSPRDLL